MLRNKSRSRGLPQRRKLRFESLESRRVLAGNVTASLGYGLLKLTGDAADNQIQVRRVEASGRVVITSLDGTTING